MARTIWEPSATFKTSVTKGNRSAGEVHERERRGTSVASKNTSFLYGSHVQPAYLGRWWHNMWRMWERYTNWLRSMLQTIVEGMQPKKWLSWCRCCVVFWVLIGPFSLFCYTEALVHPFQVTSRRQGHWRASIHPSSWLISMMLATADAQRCIIIIHISHIVALFCHGPKNMQNTTSTSLATVPYLQST